MLFLRSGVAQPDGGVGEREVREDGGDDQVGFVRELGRGRRRVCLRRRARPLFSSIGCSTFAGRILSEVAVDGDERARGERDELDVHRVRLDQPDTVRPRFTERAWVWTSRIKRTMEGGACAHPVTVKPASAVDMPTSRKRERLSLFGRDDRFPERVDAQTVRQMGSRERPVRREDHRLIALPLAREITDDRDERLRCLLGRFAAVAYLRARHDVMDWRPRQARQARAAEVEDGRDTDELASVVKINSGRE